ncbi:MAG: hypothetical protein Q7S19_02520 [bacterium]|nr:hypothetical protein [bacterium]
MTENGSVTTTEVEQNYLTGATRELITGPAEKYLQPLVVNETVANESRPTCSDCGRRHWEPRFPDPGIVFMMNLAVTIFLGLICGLPTALIDLELFIIPFFFYIMIIGVTTPYRMGELA